MDNSHGFLTLAAAVGMEVGGPSIEPPSVKLHLPSTWTAFLPLPERSDETGPAWWVMDYDNPGGQPAGSGASPLRGV